ncbi:MAG: L-fucose/L-arabinose isomerase family protein [Promethearchaeota archaeon]|nr:MAG: L-fucose/L-arabinose isomerase family protein [Candidatus Lokiarchaeota archaeon]
MTFLTNKSETITYGVIVGNRDVFPDTLAKEGRNDIIEVLNELGYNYVILNEDDTQYGVVETYQDAKKCAELFKTNKDQIYGIIVILPNFGDEKGIANALKLSNLNVPVLIQASSDEVDKMDRNHRRDAFCGKISVTSVLYQYGIPFTLTKYHTCPIKSNTFKKDLKRFEKICRIVKKLRGARLGQIGTRPNAFETVRYSEKILEFYGISIEPIDLSEILGYINLLATDDPKVKEKQNFIKNYTATKIIPDDSLIKLAKLAVVIENWVREKELDGFAFQCWPSIQDNFGIVPCAIMSMFSEGLVPAACEVDITGLIGMLILQIASETPSAILDWNNNYGDDPNKMVLFHCSNLPKSFFKDTKMTIHPIISDQKGGDVSFGAIQGRIKTKPCTLLRIETDDLYGEMKAILVEGNYTEDPLDTFGGYGVVEVHNLQSLLKSLCHGGFAHHVAATLNNVGDTVYEALTKYLGYKIEFHNTEI